MRLKMITIRVEIVLLLAIVVMPASCKISAQIDPMMHKLYRDLLREYVKDVRPSEVHSQPLIVEFGFSLAQIIDVDEKNQILTTNAWITQFWTDYNLIWDPEQYGNITVIHIPHEKVWLPDIVLYNNADSNYNSALVSTDVFVTHKGRVTWLLGAIFKSSCAMNVRYYPFDEQVCYLKFASWAYSGHLVDLWPDGGPDQQNATADMSNYMTSTEWDLLGMNARRNVQNYSCCPDEPYPDCLIQIRIKRKPMFYVFNLILPCILITGIALLGFYMPADSGEKVTLGITTLLSVTVFLMLVAESMPPTSDTLPLIGMYYGVTICLVSFATALTVFTLNIHHKGLRGNPVPRFIKIVAFKYVAPLLCVTLDPPDHWSLYDDVETCTQTESDPQTSTSPSFPENHVKADYMHAPEMEPLTSVSVPMLETSFSNGGLSPTLLTRVRQLGNGGSVLASPSPRHSQTGCSVVQQRGSTDHHHQRPNHHPLVPCTGDIRDDFEAQFVRVLHKVYSSIQKNEIRLLEQDRRDVIKLEWQQVALITDRFLLIVFVVTTTLVSLFIMYQRQLFFE